MRPVSGRKQNAFQRLCQALDAWGVKAEWIDFAEIGNYIEDVDILVFADEDEMRAVDTLAKNIWKKVCKIWSYKDFIDRSIVGILGYEQFANYLRKLNTEGVSVLNLFLQQNSVYADTLVKSIKDRWASLDVAEKNTRIPIALSVGFFDDLYTEEYAEQIRNIPIAVDTKSADGKLKDCNSRYYNVTNGERYTVGQPDSYVKTVWFVSACPIVGVYVEDKYTIASFCQRRFNETEYKIRAVNYSSLGHQGGAEFGYEKLITRMTMMPLRRGDIVIGRFDDFSYDGIANLNLYDVCEKKKVNTDWFIDHAAHCNHKVNALYADAIFDALQPILSETPAEQGELIEQDRDFVKAVYLDKYFADFAPAQYGKIGAIVMNCNPFTYGHRYLVEQALKTVDFLILFVVEEDKSVFSFHERFAMVRAGVSDLANVKVVPSGPFILSQTSFPEYFIKEADEDLAENVENDVTFFAERIAPHLNITYRFVGEEPEDKVTNEYNAAMKRILPAHGITLVELPRKEINGGYISASRVRQCLEDNDVDGLAELIPQSTREILFGE